MTAAPSPEMGLGGSRVPAQKSGEISKHVHISASREGVGNRQGCIDGGEIETAVAAKQLQLEHLTGMLAITFAPGICLEGGSSPTPPIKHHIFTLNNT